MKVHHQLTFSFPPVYFFVSLFIYNHSFDNRRILYWTFWCEEHRDIFWAIDWFILYSILAWKTFMIYPLSSKVWTRQWIYSFLQSPLCLQWFRLRCHMSHKNMDNLRVLCIKYNHPLDSITFLFCNLSDYHWHRSFYSNLSQSKRQKVRWSSIGYEISYLQRVGSQKSKTIAMVLFLNNSF